MKPTSLLRKVMTGAMAIVLLGAVSACATNPALKDDATSLARWQTSYDDIRGMSPKWGLQGIDAFKKTMDAGVPVIFVDVRTPKEWSGGVIKDAVLINLNTLPTAEGLAKLPQDQNAIIAIYCKSGHRSTLALPMLHQLGYKNAISMTGGWVAWSKAGYPTMSGPPMK